MEQLARDVGFGLRQVRRNPAFSGIAIATLALGIGANTAMFSAVDAVLIRPLPYVDAGRLVMIWDDDTARTGSRKFFSTPPEWQEWRQHNTVFTDIAASQPGDAALSNNGEPEDLPARKVTGSFWTVLGAQPLARTRLHRGRRRPWIAGRCHQPRALAAALCRVTRRRGPHDHAERQCLRGHRRHAA